MDILQRIDSATVGHKGNAALLGRGSWRQLNENLKGHDRVMDLKLGVANYIVSLRGRDLFCILDEGLWPYSIKTHNVNP